MKKFKVSFRDGSDDLIVSAKRFVTDGAGVRFYDEEGELVASFMDGHVARVIPADV